MTGNGGLQIIAEKNKLCETLGLHDDVIDVLADDARCRVAVQSIY
jgi:hypothetical protein